MITHPSRVFKQNPGIKSNSGEFRRHIHFLYSPFSPEKIWLETLQSFHYANGNINAAENY